MEVINDPPDTTSLDPLWLKDGLVTPRPALDFQAAPLLDLRLWCIRHARYALPTTELIDWLAKMIDGRPAIEVGAGQGDLGSALGIPMSDNCCQRLPDVQVYYRRLGQATTDPPSFVEEIDAVKAVEKHRPKVVVAAWLTQKYNGTGNGNMYGPEEDDLLAGDVETYVHIGNENVHKDKRILRFRHDEHRFPWLVSRAADQSKNVIWVWNRPKCGWRGIS